MSSRSNKISNVQNIQKKLQVIFKNFDNLQKLLPDTNKYCKIKVLVINILRTSFAQEHIGN